MKKNLLIIVSIVLCLILNMMFNPTVVKADEDEQGQDNVPTLNENNNNNDNDGKDEKEELEGNDKDQEKDQKEGQTDETNTGLRAAPTNESTDGENNTPATDLESGLKAAPTSDDAGSSDSSAPSDNMIEATIKIVWDHGDNPESNRPKSMTAFRQTHGYAAETITLNDANNWTATSSLPEYVNVGTEENPQWEIADYTWTIKYNWDNASLPEGYKVQETKTEGTVTTITIVYSPSSTTNVQTAKIVVTKVDEDGNPLKGALLQILKIVDGKKEVVYEWTSNGEEEIIYLPNGEYILHEENAPEGYEVADDQTIIVKIEVPDIDVGVDFSKEPCEHYEGTPLYYVTIKSVKHEVYCINQDWETPDGNSQYDGEILDPDDIRLFTQQTVNINAHQEKDKIDVSDQSLDNQQLYDKILDIIYHRYDAVKEFSDLSEEEIRYVTELALKNYTNAGLTRVQGVHKNNLKILPENYDKYDSYVSGAYTWYLYPWYRSFIYNPDGTDSLYTMVLGEGDAFGTLARHWSDGHNAATNAETRAKVARYYELYTYLIRDENNDGKADHPTEMHLYMYSTNDTSSHSSGNNFDNGAYQNLLGITGYLEDVIQEEQEYEVVNKYSTATTSLTVTKKWEEPNENEAPRPTQAIVNILANNEVIKEVILNEENGWTYTEENLPLYNNGVKIEYSVSEQKIELYEPVITGSVEEGFVITNFYSPKGGDNPPPPGPQTGDSIVLSIIMLISSTFGLGTSVYLKKRFN